MSEAEPSRFSEERLAGMSGLARSLAATDFALAEDQVAGVDALVARRPATWIFAVHFHIFVIAFEIEDLNIERAEMLSNAARDYAIQNKGGLPRGMQTGTGTLPTFVSRAPKEEVREWFRLEHVHRRGALVFPVLADLGAHELVVLRGGLQRGQIFEPDVRRVLREVLAPGLQCKVPAG